MIPLELAYCGCGTLMMNGKTYITYYRFTETNKKISTAVNKH
jgi:hypothetical protein